MKEFECTKCGACCKSIRHIQELKDFALESGTCKHLLKDNTCGIYENRPIICRVNSVYNFVSSIMTADEWHTLNRMACEELQSRNL